MPTYQYNLNITGMQAITNFLCTYGKSNISVTPFYYDAELAADNAFLNGDSAIIEISGHYSYDSRPYTLTLEKIWFDVVECNE
jgi:hypothetical protein